MRRKRSRTSLGGVAGPVDRLLLAGVQHHFDREDLAVPQFLQLGLVLPLLPLVGVPHDADVVPALFLLLCEGFGGAGGLPAADGDDVLDLLQGQMVLLRAQTEVQPLEDPKALPHSADRFVQLRPSTEIVLVWLQQFLQKLALPEPVVPHDKLPHADGHEGLVGAHVLLHDEVVPLLLQVVHDQEVLLGQLRQET